MKIEHWSDPEQKQNIIIQHLPRGQSRHTVIITTTKTYSDWLIVSKKT